MKKLLATIRNSQRGDTIVEVVLALAVLGLVLGTSSVLANRNTKTLQTSQENTYALRVAQAQLEYLRTYIANEATVLSDGDKFCLLGSTEDDKFEPDDDNCKVSNGGAEYSRVITIEKINEGKIQDGLRAYVNVNWDTLTSPGNVQLTYRTYKKLVAGDVSKKSSCGFGQGLNEITGECEKWPIPTLNFSVNGKNEIKVNEGDSVQLAWQTEYATACSAKTNGTWNGDKPISGSESVTPGQGTTKYELMCTGPGGNETKTVSVTIQAPVEPLRLCFIPIPNDYYYDPIGVGIWSTYLTTEDSCSLEAHYQKRGYSTDEYQQILNIVDMYSNRGAIETGEVIGYVPMSKDRSDFEPIAGFFDSSYFIDRYEYADDDLIQYFEQYGMQHTGEKFYVSSGCTDEGAVPLYSISNYYSYYYGYYYGYDTTPLYIAGDLYSNYDIYQYLEGLLDKYGVGPYIYYTLANYYYGGYYYDNYLGCIFQSEEQL